MERIQLNKNGKLFMIDDSVVIMREFEHRVTLWNNEHSGWDERNNFWTVRVVQEGTDPDQPVPEYLGGMLS